MSDVEFQIAGLGAAESRDGVVVAQAQDSLDSEDVAGGEELDVEPLGEVDVFGALGVTAIPYPATPEGRAEGVVVSPCGGLSAVCVAARDTRGADKTGNMKPGDVTLATTHPKSKAQWQCCGELNQAVGYVEDSDGDTMLVQVDGQAKTLTLSIPNQMIVMKKGDGITLTVGAATIKISEDGSIDFIGKPTFQTGSGVPVTLLGTPTPMVPVVVTAGAVVPIAGAGAI
jgi:hypothetical protein